MERLYLYRNGALVACAYDISASRVSYPGVHDLCHLHVSVDDETAHR